MIKNASVENILWAMDKYGVDIACLLPESMMDATGYATRWVTNGEMAKIVETNPDRFMLQPNVSPIKHRGVKNVIHELVYWVKEKGAKIFKFYPPEDTYMNDPEIWPFYEKAQELGIVLDIHTGFSWVPPGKSKYALPVQLDDVARDFPDLKINAFHMGYPYCDDLNMIAMQHPNVYVCLSLLCPWTMTAPRKFGKIIGEALQMGRSGQDYLGLGLCGIRRTIQGGGHGVQKFPDSRGPADAVRLSAHNGRRQGQDLRRQPRTPARNRYDQAQNQVCLRQESP